MKLDAIAKAVSDKCAYTISFIDIDPSIPPSEQDIAMDKDVEELLQLALPDYMLPGNGMTSSFIMNWE